jgi:hypothetical protein
LEDAPRPFFREIEALRSDSFSRWALEDKSTNS